MKLTTKHFKVFKKECLKWQNRFELHNWELHFRWQDTDKDRAGLTINLDAYIATAFLSRNWDNYDKISKNDIKIVAKHEMIHLLLGRISALVGARFLTTDERDEADEETVRKLEFIIK